MKTVRLTIICIKKQLLFLRNLSLPHSIINGRWVLVGCAIHFGVRFFGFGWVFCGGAGGGCVYLLAGFFFTTCSVFQYSFNRGETSGLLSELELMIYCPCLALAGSGGASSWKFRAIAARTAQPHLAWQSTEVHSSEFIRQTDEKLPEFSLTPSSAISTKCESGCWKKKFISYCKRICFFFPIRNLKNYHTFYSSKIMFFKAEKYKKNPTGFYWKLTPN